MSLIDIWRSILEDRERDRLYKQTVYIRRYDLDGWPHYLVDDVEKQLERFSLLLPEQPRVYLMDGEKYFDAFDIEREIIIQGLRVSDPRNCPWKSVDLEKYLIEESGALDV